MKRLLFIGLISVAFFACVIVDTDYDESNLDGSTVFDSLPYLISDSFPDSILTDSIRDIPVIIAAHGFSATTYEWLDFATYSETFRNTNEEFFVSRILMGGHGRTYEDFKAATWEDWQQPVINEYKKLHDKGFRNISLAGSSTGGTVVLELLASGKLKDYVAPGHVFLVDAILVAGNKFLNIADWVGPIIGNNIVKKTGEEKGHWYQTRPSEALNQLLDIMGKVINDLENGITLRSGTEMVIYKTQGDQTVDPISGLMIYKGVEESNGSKPRLAFVDSKLHVFTRLSGREGTPTSKDTSLQQRAFDEMKALVLGNTPTDPL